MARALLMRRIALAALCLVGCSPKWTDADAKSATNASRAELMIETLCADGQPCTPSQVRALERMAYCSNASMLTRHGAMPPASAIVCAP